MTCTNLAGVQRDQKVMIEDILSVKQAVELQALLVDVSTIRGSADAKKANKLAQVWTFKNQKIKCLIVLLTVATSIAPAIFQLYPLCRTRFIILYVQAICETGAECGILTRAQTVDYHVPLSNVIGDTLEIEEVFKCLSGKQC